jgi:voltage-gated sodium channel
MKYLRSLFLSDKFILIVILLNAGVIFVSGFNLEAGSRFIVEILDNLFTSLFIIELVIKINEYGFKKYLKSKWNKFDFILIILSMPALLAFVFNLDVATYSFLLVFRVLRLFKTFRFIKFVPGIEDLIRGVQRALKASVIVLIGFAIYIFIISIVSFFLFKNVTPHYFGNPLLSLYSIFKIFTVEGWFEIPETISSNFSEIKAFFTYFYFIFVLLSGGIFGLSLVNSIFVDAMISDNTDELQVKIDSLEKKIDRLLTQNESL